MSVKATLSEECGAYHDVIKHFKDMRARRVYGAYDRSVPLPRQLEQDLYDIRRALAIQARCWLIQQQDAWVCNQLHPYAKL